MLTAVATTVISFLPVFTMKGAEGKLFSPLAYTKTFALIGAILVTLTLIPPLARWFIAGRVRSRLSGWGLRGAVALAGLVAPLVLTWFPFWLGVLLVAVAGSNLLGDRIPDVWRKRMLYAFNMVFALVIVLILARTWAPLGLDVRVHNIIFVVSTVGGLLLVLMAFMHFNPRILAGLLRAKTLFLALSSLIVVWGLVSWLSVGQVFGWLPG